MSSSTPTLPPNSSSLAGRLPKLTERAKALLTAVNLHYAGVAALLVIVLYLIIHLFVLWNALDQNSETALSAARAQSKAAEIAAQPLRGLDSKVDRSTEDADAFYGARLPYAYSQVAAELGALAKKSGVRLTRVQYSQLPQLSGKYALTEVRMDASVSGDYRPVVQFLNALERDHTFFVISGINLTGQQTGQVNLRIRLMTYLRPSTVDESTRELVIPGNEAKPNAGGAQ
ncbi:GspMb/PilO family protein [Granulicella cerasi]|uniref:GspMb/PilO family protein n=1 Tax=Granulicella cerasi TaxID=741063 RepID=A0ABW1ZBP8_9BACT|nr:GspMb/PilO family protein [Granulicella cerasi]